MKNTIDEILSGSLFYPACGEDGLPVKFFNEHYKEYGIDSFVYVDYAMSGERLRILQDGFRYYHVKKEQDLQERDLTVPGSDYKQYASILTAEEIASQQEVVFGMYGDTIKPFSRLIVYERDKEADPARGPEHFTLLYIGAEAVAAYAALYRTRNIAPKAMAIIAPGTGWGGNYTDFYDPDSALLRIICQGKSRPQYILFGYDKIWSFEQYLKYARDNNHNNLPIMNNHMGQRLCSESVLELPYLSNELTREIVLGNMPKSFTLNNMAYQDIVESNEDYSGILQELRQKSELNREYITTLYDVKPIHEAVFATLIWGGLNRANINRYLKEEALSINNKILNVKEMIFNGDIEAAFRSMLNGGENHINGVGISFFTKILFFLSAHKEGLTPLIFDKWTQTIHAVSLPDDGAQWYLLSKTEKGTYNAPQFTSNTVIPDAYLDYITKMHNLSIRLGVSSGLIEEYLFGSSRKFFPNEWNDTNPRKRLLDYVLGRPSCRVV